MIWRKTLFVLLGAGALLGVIVGASWLWETWVWWLIEARVYEAAQAACWGG
jgi:hypothetical protein